jgi:hypothetical protein
LPGESAIVVPAIFYGEQRSPCDEFAANIAKLPELVLQEQ